MIGLHKAVNSLSPMKIILYGYIIIIFIGALLLFLPFSANNVSFTPFSDAFFTSASAVCVTGLVRFDTYQHWSLFGKLVILSLIQIGGIGFMTMAVYFMTFINRKIGLPSRIVMQNSISAPQLGGIVKMTKFIVKGTILFELAGTVLLSFYFCPEMGMAKGLFYSFFHSVSAFCNAGFDLMGYQGEYSSLTSLYGNVYVNVIIMSLIILGGLGFFVWKDLEDNKFRFKKLRLHSKIVLSSSIILIVLGAIFIFALEYLGNAYENFTLKEKLLSSLFQSVTSRTAGFNTADLTKYSEGSLFVMMCLMLVGGSPGSTAGGIKTTTFAVIVLSIFAAARRKKECQIFGRRIEEDVFPTVSCIFISYLLLICVSSVVISHIEGISMLAASFESVSAVATVGLSLGVTPSLGFISKIIIACLMIVGRVGSLTVLLAVTSPKDSANVRFPAEKIQVG